MNEEYFKKHINKNVPVKIAWNEYARGFYCPTCRTGTTSDTKKCGYCGQLLISYFGKQNNKQHMLWRDNLREQTKAIKDILNYDNINATALWSAGLREYDKYHVAKTESNNRKK